MIIACFRKRMSDRHTCMGTWVIDKLAEHNSCPGNRLDGYPVVRVSGSQNVLYKTANGENV